MKESSRGLLERLLDWLLWLLLRRKIADNQRYLIQTWDRFERSNRERSDDDPLSFTSFAVFSKRERLLPERRVRIMTESAYQALIEHIGPTDSQRVSIKYFTPSSDYSGHCAYIYLWAEDAKQV